MRPKPNKYLFYLALLGCFLGCQQVAAQKQGPLKQEVWESVTKEIDYGPGPEGAEQVEEEEAQEATNQRDREKESFWANFFKVLFIVAAIVIIAYLFYHMVEGDRAAKKRGGQQDQSLQVTVDQLEQDLEKASLPPVIREAERTQNYPLAIRLRYLQIIQGMAKRELIQWKREKTNGEYILEIKHPQLKGQFVQATHIFEQVWYGNRPMNHILFQSLSQKLEATHASLDQYLQHEH